MAYTRRRVRRRRNPFPGGWRPGDPLPAPKKRTVSKGRKAAGKKSAKSRKRGPGGKFMTASTKKATTSKKKSTTAKKSSPKKTTKKKSAPKKKSTMSKKARSEAAKKGWRRKRAASAKKSRGGKKSMSKTAIKRRRQRAARKAVRTKNRKAWRRYKTTSAKARRSRPGRKVTKKGGRGVKSAKMAKSARRYQRAYGSGAVLRIARKNPGDAKGTLVATLKAALPVGVTFFGARMLSRAVLPRIPGLDRLGRHAAPVGAVAMFFLGHFGLKKVKSAKVAKYRDQVLLGFGLNVLDVVAKTYMPQSIKDRIGMSGDVYDSALGEYVGIGGYTAEMGEYVGIGAYEAEMGEYVGIGAEQELGSLGDGAFLSSGIGTGIGTPAGALVRSVQSEEFTSPVPSKSFTAPVADVGAGFDSHHSLYTGIFRGGF